MSAWKPAVLIAASLCGSWAAEALAQSAADDSAQPAQLDEINVVGRREFDERFMSTATRITINRRDIEAMGANSIGNILRQTPSLQVTTTANGGLEIRMRGMGTESTRILVDGVAASTTNRSAQLPLDELPADLIERIEVLRAPTAEHQGAAGGTLNIVLRGALPKKETFIWFTDQMVWGQHGPSVFVSQTGPLGEQPVLRKGALPNEEAATPNWSYFISLNAGKRNLGSDTRRESSVNTAAPTASNIVDEVRLENSYWTLTPRFTGRFGARDRVTLRGIVSGFDQDGRVVSSVSGIFAGAPLTSLSQAPWMYERSFYQGAVDWSHSFTDAKWDSTVQVERARSDYRSNRSAVTTVGGVTTNPFTAYGEQRAETALIAKSKVDIAAGQAVWSFGADYEGRKLDTDSVAANVAGVTPRDLDASIRRLALWGQHELPVEYLKTAMVFGLRAQDFSTDVATGTAASATQYHALNWQPSFNSRTAITDNLQYRFNLARISRNPRVWELAPLDQPNLSTNSPNAPDYLGNPNLRPETTITLDTGIDRRLAGNGQAGVNLFVRQQSDVIRRRLFLSGTRWVEQPDNIGDALIWGIETDVRTNLTWAGFPREWTLSANASLLNSRFNDGVTSGQRIPGQSRYLATINIAKPLRQSGGWYGGGAMVMHGSADQNSPSSPGVIVSGSQRANAQLDLHIGSVIPKLLFWRLNVYNVTDFKQDRSRVVVDTLAGTVTTEHSERQLTPRWFLTIGTRF